MEMELSNLILGPLLLLDAFSNAFFRMSVEETVDHNNNTEIFSDGNSTQ